MSWPFDASEPFVTAERAVLANRDRRGLIAEADTLPPLMIGTFQGAAYERLLSRAGVDPAHEPGKPPGGIASRTMHATGSLGGRPVRVVRFSVGGPMVGITLELAIARGVRDILVVGSSGGLQPDLPLGSTVVVDGVDPIGRQDGTSHHYLPAGEAALADPELTAALEDASAARGVTPRRGRAWTTDAPYRTATDGLRQQVEAGTLVVEMEAAALFAVARLRGARAGLIVTVSDTLVGQWEPGFGKPAYLDALTRAADVVADVAESLAS
ncbi:nucleoside phosphorylase-I family protein [Flindersiella endophytica]